jgi:hypothetical protein
MTKHSGARQKTLDKALSYFTEINSHLEKNNGKLLSSDNRAIAKKHNTAEYLIHFAVKKGYYQKIERSVYAIVVLLTTKNIRHIIELYNKERAKLRGNNSDSEKKSPVTISKSRQFKNGMLPGEKFFVVNSSGEVHCKPTGIRNATKIAMKNAQVFQGKCFYICEISKAVQMEYVPSIKEL